MSRRFTWQSHADSQWQESLIAALLWLRSLMMEGMKLRQTRPDTDCCKIIFLGDSITQAGVLQDGYIALAAEQITQQYPYLAIELVGAGINGHKVLNCLKRLDRDVLQKNPSIVVIYIGVNDVWHWQQQRGTTAEDFESGLRDMIARIHLQGAKVILCTPSVIGEKTDATNKYDNMLDAYAQISRTVAHESGSQLLDLRVEFLRYIQVHNPDNAATGILTKDGVHLNKAGNHFLSQLVLGALTRSLG
ncbi:MAG: G-D-S-L family lipolytic protein [Zetaproteobacteria bacterium CG_4_9_14_3_um_filter_49_83]|nr:MAG: G-D-S-L family lipolytic protein [Zetaproteobacteria bacterium CG17_big_fil_post_rev_8_21_14_2_50_50_13]PIV29981.1 MAG: G-D-S-L family lipolytic protein [Zetaproteobacteria bacterium CG02_land_8_20_14_3_00_50_9]PIY55427.1 MAG: G-D-S-L family lipolytic protein [Zetaproteobacteria bacterium CG_4_10_14_0_8_um_filter_49_80]PJA34558.1 MAG: G-D-S-L family lipolytic protein [Zetaproteobacteria bacterium CG_4_9_14_3_um_filter_49_83]